MEIINIFKALIAGFLIGLLFAFIAFLTFKDKIYKCPEFVEIERTVDTIYVPVTIDPTPVPVKVDSVPIPKPVRQKPVQRDTVRSNDTIVLTVCDTINTYEYTHSDSLIDVKFITDVQGLLLKQSFEYKIKPINTTVPVIKETITLREKSKGLYLMGGLDFTVDIYEPKVSIGALYQKDKMVFGLSYVPKDKGITGHIGFRLIK